MRVVKMRHGKVSVGCLRYEYDRVTNQHVILTMTANVYGQEKDARAQINKVTKPATTTTKRPEAAAVDVAPDLAEVDAAAVEAAPEVPDPEREEAAETANAVPLLAPEDPAVPDDPAVVLELAAAAAVAPAW